MVEKFVVERIGIRDTHFHIIQLPFGSFSSSFFLSPRLSILEKLTEEV